MFFQAALSQLRTKVNQYDQARLALYAALILALANGLVYMALIPPWQHNDEPNHFEYAWLVANRTGLPKPGDYDPEMRRVVQRSMIEHGFFDHMSSLPDLSPATNPAYIGPYSQLSDPPLYYLIASLPLRLFSLWNPYQNIDFQYRSVQLISLLLYLATIFAAWGLVKDLAGASSSLVWIVPVCVALEPSFNGVMTSINDDVGAIAAFTFFLWGAIFLIQRGFSWKGLVWATGVAMICAFTKSNVYFAILLLPLAVLLSILPQRWKKWFWVGVGIVSLTSLLVIFKWGDASDWYRNTVQAGSTRQNSTAALSGSHVFALASQGGLSNPATIALQQIVAFQNRNDLSRQPVTLGAWIWASQPMSIRGPMVKTYRADFSIYENIQVTQKPAFYTFSTVLPENTILLQVVLSPFSKSTPPGSVVYYDGIVFLKGQWPADQTPQFSSPLGDVGTWGGVDFTNLLQNGSAETAWLQVSSWVDRFGSQVMPDHAHPSIIQYSILHFKDLAFYYESMLANLIRTFWAKFGWEQVSLPGQKPYRVLILLMAASLIGVGISTWRFWKKIPWHATIFLGIAILGIWLTTILMGTIYIFVYFFHPSARYTFPVMAPVTLLLVCGWMGLAPKKILKYVKGIIPFVFMLINILAISSIYRFYR